jgi:CHAD domain-containing protein
MKAGKELKKYFRKRTRNIDHSLNELKHSFVPENFHELRVEIKKMKALFKLISFFSKKFDRGHLFKPYKKIFKEAGNVRELQLEEEVLKTNKNAGFPEKYRRHLKELRLKGQITFCRSIDSQLLNELKRSEKEVLALLKKGSKKMIHNYAHKNWNKTKKLVCRDKLMTNDIHKFRKKLKSLYYLKGIGRNKELKKELKPLKGLMETMGEWHDKLVMGQRLRKIIPEEIKKRESKSLKELKMKLGKQRQLLFHKINKEIKISCGIN